MEKEWVLVDCISTFRIRYMIEVPKGKTEWALDTVAAGEAKEFSQHNLGELVVSHRSITKDDGLILCDQDNEYCAAWDEATKLKNFVTLIEK